MQAPSSHSEIRDYFLEKCFVRDDKVFASGIQANNKIDMERLANDPVAHALVERLGGLIVVQRPEFLVAVPNGASWMTAILCNQLSIPEVQLTKHQDRSVDYLNAEEATKVLSYEQGVLIEDIFNRFTNTRKVLSLPGMSERVVAVTALMDRGEPSIREPLEIPHFVLVHEPIPEQLPPDSVYWKYAE
jgi:orotate phosphoribosyltransferase